MTDLTEPPMLSDAPILSDTLDSARRLWEAGRYADAEELLSPAAAAAAGAEDAEAEARLRVALATTLKYRNAFTRAYAEVARVLSLAGVSADVAECGRRLAISLSYELRRFDRVEQLAGDRMPELRFLAISYLKSGQHDRAYATAERIIAIAERDGDQVKALRTRCDLALWRVLPTFGDTGGSAGRPAVGAALDVFAQCESALAAMNTAAGRAARAALDGHRAVVLQAAGRIPEAWEAVRRSIAHADASGLPAERGTARKLAATLLLGRALRGDATVFEAAEQMVEEMFRFLLDTETAAGLVEAARIAARLDQARGLARDDRRAFQSAVAWLEHADRWMLDARRETREPGAESTDTTQLALIAGATDLYVLAINILLEHLLDAVAAFEWTERLKGRAMAELAGMGVLTPPVGIVPESLADEARALAALAAARTHAEIWQAHQALERAWEQLAADPAAGPYVALRRGAALSYRDLRRLLAEEDGRVRAYRAKARLVVIEFVVVGDQLVVFGARSDFDAPAVHVVPSSYAALVRAIATMTRDPLHELAALLADSKLQACVTLSSIGQRPATWSASSARAPCMRCRSTPSRSGAGR